MSYAKFQRDPPTGSEAISEKLMGGGRIDPLHGRRLNNAKTVNNVKRQLLIALPEIHNLRR